MKSKTSPYRQKICRRKKRGPNASGKCAGGFRRAIRDRMILDPRMLPFITAKGIQGRIGRKSAPIYYLYI